MARDQGKGGAAPTIIRRVVEEGGHGHHGGAWKVAYADFVTAMMAFFLMLWLLSTSTEDTLKGLAEYFSDSSANDGPPGGVGGVLNGISVLPAEPIFDQPSSVPTATDPALPSLERHVPEAEDAELLRRPDHADGMAGAAAAAAAGDDPGAEARAQREQAGFDAARAAILRGLERAPELRAFADNLVIEDTPEGLRIQIIDREGVPMFPSGSDRMYPHTQELLAVVSRAVRSLPNPVSIRGHTDARPFARGTYDNWRLSSDRANATREAMLAAGLPADRVAEVIGKADAEPLFPADPADPRNRRISVVLRHLEEPAP
ncbi:MAG: flagellar motor protein MotB [Geminicoccaceae bacterium]